MKEVLGVVRNRASQFKDTIAILTENKDLLMKERIQFDNQLKDFNQQILSLKSQIDSRV